MHPSDFTVEEFHSLSDLVLIVVSINKVDSPLINIKGKINVLVSARALKHLGVLLETFSVIWIESCQPVVGDQCLVRLLKFGVEVTDFLHDFFFVQSKLDGFVET